MSVNTSLTFKKGDRVIYKYSTGHGKSTRVQREKHGEFLGMKFQKKYVTHGPYEYSSSLCTVWFDGNKYWSKVSLYMLEPES